jgi:hypothetical protein
MLAKEACSSRCKHHCNEGEACMTNEIPKGRAKGGYARAARLSQDQRSAIASEAAKMRWKDHRLPDVPRVLEGFKSELNLAGVKIPCAVISGPKGVQRVLTENGITYAILGERSGASKRLKKAASEATAKPRRRRAQMKASMKPHTKARPTSS